MRRRKWFTFYCPILCLFALTINILLIKQHNTFVGEPRSLDAVWQRVPNTSDNVFVYSAFLEERNIDRKHFRNAPFIRLIGVAKFRKQFIAYQGITFEIVCRLWYDEEETSNTADMVDVVDGAIEYIRENWMLNYTAAFVYCPLGTDSKIPTSVSLYAHEDVKESRQSDPVNLPDAHNRVRVRQNQEPGATLAACVKPIHYQFAKVWEVIEWIEFHRLLGVTHFYFYNHTMSANLTCVLNDYISQGLVTVLDWNGLPFVSQKEIRTENMFASLNDCLYRGMHKHQYLAFLDFDEYLMPKKHNSLIELIKDVERKVENFSLLIFRNAFFYLQWPDDANAPNSHLMTMRKTRRKTVLHVPKARSKYICKPQEVVEVGNHFVWEQRSPKVKEENLGLDVGFMHHYRICEFGGDGCVNQTSEIDRTTWKWTTALASAVDEVQQKLGGLCDLKPIRT